MVNMSQTRHEERINIFISRAKKHNSKKGRMTEKDCRRKASGALQQKARKQGELNMTKTNLHDEMDDQL